MSSSVSERLNFAGFAQSRRLLGEPHQCSGVFSEVTTRNPTAPCSLMDDLAGTFSSLLQCHADQSSSVNSNLIRTLVHSCLAATTL